MKEGFSQDWGVYKLITHETRPCTLWELENIYTLSQYLDMLETVEVFDEMEQIRRDNQPKN